MVSLVLSYLAHTQLLAASRISPRQNERYSRKRLKCCAEEPPPGEQLPTSRWDFLQQLAQSEGFRLENAECDEETETWEEAMEEVEDPWMREPSENSFADMSETALPSTDVALSNKNVPLISEEDYQAMKAVDTDDCIVLLDVRSATDFRESPMTGAINIPLEFLNSTVAAPWRSKTVVLAGFRGTEAMQACTRLSKVYKLDSVFLMTLAST